MNDKIKTILEKHNILPCQPILVENLNSAIIEICEEQKKECASKYEYPYNEWILNSKNIAE
jgi:hypothetical protein